MLLGSIVVHNFLCHSLVAPAAPVETGKSAAIEER